VSVRPAHLRRQRQTLAAGPGAEIHDRHARPRLDRAGADRVETRAIEDPRDPWLAGLAGRCERVLVDAPCSGSGAWRRQPDARWRLTAEDLVRYRAAQDEALAGAAPLVASGGRLIYATCSLLEAENGAPVARFLAGHEAFAALDPEPLWRAALGGPCPRQGEGVLLSPARCVTDGFYIAVLERRGAA
jgi:16S rRNA (cytosine967-C5)-methyltransferase